jgi:peptidoglycan/LPS O-acetylase OafA/YrhL
MTTPAAPARDADGDPGEPADPGTSVTTADPEPPAPATRGRPTLPHVAALDGVRGAAVLAVLAFHAGHLRGGWLGVDLFFALSGYLITALLLTDHKAGGRVDLAGFWSRRARRLGPALILTLVGVGLYAATVAIPQERLVIRWDGLATLFEAANWRTILTGGDYWQHAFRPSPLQHTWSLAVEEQLYLVWPLAVAGVLAWKGRARAVLVVAGIGAAASAAAMVGLHLAGADQTRLYQGTDTRAVTVLLGAAVAALRVTIGPAAWARTRPARQALGLLAALGLGLAWARLDGNGPWPYRGLLPLAGLGGALLVASLADRNHPGALGRVLAVPPLVFLGRISYGLYLYHWPVFLWLDRSRTHLDGWAHIGAQVAVSIGLAWLSYRFVELPVRRGWPSGRQARAAVPAAAAVAVIALLAGTQGAIPPPDLAKVGNGIQRSSRPGAPTLMLAGDSVPLVMGLELAHQLDELGINLVNDGSPGCHLLVADGPIRGIQGDIRSDVADCAQDGAYRKIVEEQRPDAVLVLFGEFPNESVRIDGTWTMPCQARYLDALRHRLDLLIDDLRATRATVVLATAPGSNISWVIDRVPPGMAERVACTNDVLRDLARTRTGVGIVDLAEYICPTGSSCRETVDGIDLRTDSLHFEGPGAAYVNRWLVPRVLEQIGEV